MTDSKLINEYTMTNREYIQKAKEIVEKYNLQKYVDVLLDYWEENPTTLGHGFEHVLKAGVECYLLAADNGYTKPEELFVGGLYHDIYRPAKGQDAAEDHHEETAAAIKSVFDNNGLSKYIKNKIIIFLDTQDSWRKGDSKNIPDFDLYLFLGERATHRSLMADAYAWASNQYTKKNGLEPIYTSHLRTTYGLVKYQLDVWKVMMKYQYLKVLKGELMLILKCILMLRINTKKIEKLNISMSI